MNITLTKRTPLIEAWVQWVAPGSTCAQCSAPAIARIFAYADQLAEMVADLQAYGHPVCHDERVLCRSCLTQLVHTRGLEMEDHGDSALRNLFAGKAQSLVFVRFYGDPGFIHIVASRLGSMSELMAQLQEVAP